MILCWLLKKFKCSYNSDQNCVHRRILFSYMCAYTQSLCSCFGLGVSVSRILMCVYMYVPGRISDSILPWLLCEDVYPLDVRSSVFTSVFTHAHLKSIYLTFKSLSARIMDDDSTTFSRQICDDERNEVTRQRPLAGFILIIHFFFSNGQH